MPKGVFPRELAIHRFMRKIRIDENTQCWIWTGLRMFNGKYGSFQVKKKRHLSHRWSYEFHKGEIPDGLYIDHICRNKLCVNPDHLRAVTPQINSIENNDGATYINSLKTHCNNGHPLVGENLVKNKKTLRRKYRQCLECKRAAGREYWKRKRFSPASPHHSDSSETAATGETGAPLE